MIRSDIDLALRTAVDAARAAGDVLLRGLASSDKGVRAKAHANDPVTVYDREAEDAILRILSARHPEDGVLSEEGAATDGTSGRRWLLDPLDGTSNFAAGVPHFAVSIALAEADVTIVGCVHDPVRDETFTAARGDGARVAEKRIAVSGRGALDGASVGVGLSYDPRCRARLLQRLEPFLARAGVLRTLGSAALDLAYVAAGRFDVVWYPALHPWDVAAGGRLVEEAGGRVTDLDGLPPLDPTRGIVASNGRIHGEFLHALR